MNKQTLNKTIAAAVLLLSVTFLTAQNNFNSPYSRYGMGELNFNKVPFLSSMGGTSIAFKHPNFINFSNPASYSGMQKRTFLFDGGAFFTAKEMKTDDLSQIQYFANISHLQFSFPAMPDWGFSFGIVPYSNIGYNLSDEETLDSIGLVKYSYEGWGGLNNAYVGTGASLFKGFSIGANMNYYFGSIERVRIAEFDTTGFTNTRLRNKFNISDINFNAGIQYSFRFKKKTEDVESSEKIPSDISLTIGFTAGNPKNLNTTENILAERISGNSSYSIARDTVWHLADNKTSIRMPLSIGGGLFLQKDKRWMLGLDMEWQKWSDFTFTDISDSLKDSRRISAGGCFTPKEKPVPTMLSRSSFLWGVHYYQNHLELKNTPLNQLGISFGISMPIRQTGTTLQISLEMGKAGTTNNSLIEETYGKLRIGVSITERWFYRRKYD